MNGAPKQGREGGLRLAHAGLGAADAGRAGVGNEVDRIAALEIEDGMAARAALVVADQCYAKVIRLDPAAEREIYATASRFGTILDNVMNEARDLGLETTPSPRIPAPPMPVPDKPKHTAVSTRGPMLAELCVGSTPPAGSRKFITVKIDFLISHRWCRRSGRDAGRNRE